VGFSGATRANSPNAGAIFVVPKGFEERTKHGPTANELLATLQGALATIPEAELFVIPPPPVQGLGTAGGFKLIVQDRSASGYQVLQAATDEMVDATRRGVRWLVCSRCTAPRRLSSLWMSIA
jgi:multidrug efflux pump subunit AcrB